MKTRPTIKHLSSSQVLRLVCRKEAPGEGEALDGTQLSWPIRTDWIDPHSLFLPLFSAEREVVAPTTRSAWVTLYRGAALATFVPCKSPGLSEKLEPSPRSLFLARV